MFENEGSSWIAALLQIPGLDEDTEQLLLHARHRMLFAGDDVVEVIAQELRQTPSDEPVT